MREEFIKLKQQVKKIEEQLEKRKTLHHKGGDAEFYYSNDILNARKKEVAKCHTYDTEEGEEDEYEEIDEPEAEECLLEDMVDENTEVATATKELSEMEDIEEQNNQVAAVKEKVKLTFGEFTDDSDLHVNDVNERDGCEEVENHVAAVRKGEISYFDGVKTKSDLCFNDMMSDSEKRIVMVKANDVAFNFFECYYGNGG
ncbi:hypothetical protein SUGI_1124880 [Cryptomeria japonica]|nr:hypothetical protein SUGI_1124880 [Cryptomeria japonica]